MQHIQYEPWGAVASITGTLADTNRLRWKGLMWEGDSTRLYYVRNRWYDPVSRRFLSEDPIGLSGGINKYVFVDGDPMNGQDPLGLEGCLLLDVDIVDLVDGELVTKKGRVKICPSGGSTIGQLLDYAAKHGVGRGSAFWGGGRFATPAALAALSPLSGPANRGAQGKGFFSYWEPFFQQCLDGPIVFGRSAFNWQRKFWRIPSYVQFNVRQAGPKIPIQTSPGEPPELGYQRAYTGSITVYEIGSIETYKIKGEVSNCDTGAFHFMTQ